MMTKSLSSLFRAWKRKKSRPRADVKDSLSANLAYLQEALGGSTDVVTRQFTVGSAQPVKAALVFIDGLVDNVMINESIMKPLLLEMRMAAEGLSKKDMLAVIRDKVISMGQLMEVDHLPAVLDSILSGDTALMIDGYSSVLVSGTKGWETRGVEEPLTEAVVRGPREGFTETLRVNTSQLRRKIRNPALRFEVLTIGRQTRTGICIAYVKGLADEKIVAEVRKRLERIDVDSILESGYIEDFIEDAPLSPFAMVGNTERPDVAAAKILEGRVAILVDGTPFVLTVPYLFVESLQTSEDYYSRSFFATLIRWVRIIALVSTGLLPALFIALLTFHQEMIPTQLLLSMAASAEGVPFPAFVQAFFMGLVFEILREAGIRMPRPVGQAVSIVGALVIGQAAVEAGLVMPTMIIVVAFTGITEFIVATQIESLTLFRIFVTGLAAVLGFYGILVAVLALLIHVLTLRSFGVPYMSPLAAGSMSDLKDVLLRVPRWAMTDRPQAIPTNNRLRQTPLQNPRPPAGKKKD